MDLYITNQKLLKQTLKDDFISRIIIDYLFNLLIKKYSDIKYESILNGLIQTRNNFTNKNFAFIINNKNI